MARSSIRSAIRSTQTARASAVRVRSSSAARLTAAKVGRRRSRSSSTRRSRCLTTKSRSLPTWSGPTIVSSLVDAPVTINGQAVRTGDILPAWAAGPTGTLYVAWQDGRFTGLAAIAFSQSTDGGLTWSQPIRIDQTPGSAPAFTPQLSLASDGTVGVTYYNLQNATAAKPGLTDAFIVHCQAQSDCTAAK